MIMAVFLMENGVLSMGNKTPVTILQETLQRKGLNPHYELIYNGVGTMDPIFKYQVSASGFTAIGDGKSKKEAKHDAAAALLKRMQVGSDCSEIQEMDIASPYSGAIKQNFVGMLDEICVNNKIPFPVFVPISEYGPPHARIFTMQCKVSSCTETAVARTKKQAKHLVAQQMINRIAKIMGNKFIPIIEKNAESEDLPLDSNLKAIENGNYRHDFSIPIAEFQNVFYNKMEEFLVPQTFLDLPLKPEEFYENLENPKEFLDVIVQGLEGLTNTVPISKQALKEVFQEIEKDCQQFVWGQEEEVEDDSEYIYHSNYDDDNVHSESYLLEEFDLGDEEEKPPSALNPNDVLCSSQKVEDSTLQLVDEKKLGRSHILEQFDLGYEKENSPSALNPNDALCSSQEVETSTLQSVDDKELGGSHLLEECDLGDEEKKLPSALNHNDTSCSSQEAISALQSVDDKELDKCSIHFERDLHLDCTDVTPKFLFLSIECPQGKWTFHGVGTTIQQAEKMAAIQALKFLRVMSIPSGTKKIVDES